MADPDEPVFALRGRSRWAGAFLRAYSGICKLQGEITPEEDVKNRDLASRMDQWHKDRKLGPMRGDGKVAAE